MKFPLYIISFLVFFSFTSDLESVKRKSLKVDDPIPIFSLLDNEGDSFNSLDYIGKQPLVIFFYPKNNAPVCTTEACSFRDSFDKFEELNAKVVGISPDHFVSHRSFIKKYNLPYTLLSDYNKIAHKLFGVTRRVTFVANKKGEIIFIFKNQKNAEMHTSEALKALSKQS